MTTFSKGADVEALARIAQSIKSMQAELTAIESSSGQAMRSIQGHWGGDNLLGLVRHFTGTAMPGLRACNTIFEDMGKKLERNIAAQRSTSGQGGGSTGPGGGPNGNNGKGKPDPDDDKYGINKVDKGKGAKHDLFKPKEQDAVGDERNGYKHSTSAGSHSYERTRTDDDSNWSRTQTDVHAGDHNDRHLRHETGATYENEHRFKEPSDDDSSDDDKADGKGKKALDGAAGAVTWTEKSTPITPGYDVVMYDANGNVTTDPTKAVRTSGGDTMFADAQGYSESGMKEGALYAGAGGLAGVYLAKGGISGDIGAHGRYDASGYVGAEAKGDAGVSLGKDGLKASAKGEAFAGVKGEAGVGYDSGTVGGHASVNAMAGAEAKADASVGIGKDGVKASAGVEAFAGAKAGVDGSVNVAGIGASGGAEVYAGIGAHANVDASISAESVKVSVDIGAAIGIGGGVSFSVDINPKEFMQDTGLDDVAKDVSDVLKDPFGSISSLF